MLFPSFLFFGESREPVSEHFCAYGQRASDANPISQERTPICPTPTPPCAIRLFHCLFLSSCRFLCLVGCPAGRTKTFPCRNDSRVHSCEELSGIRQMSAHSLSRTRHVAASRFGFNMGRIGGWMRGAVRHLSWSTME